MRYFTFVALLALSVLFVSCVSQEVQIVQKSKLEMCPQKTAEQMVNGFIEKPKWSSGEAVGGDGTPEGSMLIDVTGGILYAEKPVKVAIQFIMSSNKESFEVNAVEINGLPQNALIIGELFSKMCE